VLVEGRAFLEIVDEYAHRCQAHGRSHFFFF
jgi:hypothetical protein